MIQMISLRWFPMFSLKKKLKFSIVGFKNAALSHVCHLMKEYDESSMRMLPSQRCHGHTLPVLAFHVARPPQQSQMSDSRLDWGCHVQPGQAGKSK